MTLSEAIILAFDYLEATYSPKWTKGLGSKENLIKAFSQSTIPKHEYLGYKGSDGLRHAFGRAIPNHNKPKNTLWENWLLSNIGYFHCTGCDNILTIECRLTDKNLCQECNRAKGRLKRSVNQEIIYNILKNSKCLDCGMSNPIVLEFDHRDPSTKRFNIADGYLKPKEELLQEVAKCDIVCANCHRIRTAKTYGFYSYKQTLN